MLQAHGSLGHFLAAAFLLSPLDKVTVSLIDFPELTGVLVKGVLAGNFTSLYVLAKALAGVKIIFASDSSGWGISTG